MNEREKFIIRMALIYLMSNLSKANEFFDTPDNDIISVNGDEDDIVEECEISDLLDCLQ